MDIKSAFLNADLQEEVYVVQPLGYTVPDKEEKVLRLRKALYGLRQAPTDHTVPGCLRQEVAGASSNGRLLPRERANGGTSEVEPGQQGQAGG